MDREKGAAKTIYESCEGLVLRKRLVALLLPYECEFNVISNKAISTTLYKELSLRTTGYPALHYRTNQLIEPINTLCQIYLGL
jgi:hypothetical protein